MKNLRASLPGRLIFGVKGDPGAVFRPNVDEEGTISWTNNGGLANPAPQNIRGPKGEKGDNIFLAEYGVSTYEQVTAAMDKGLLCVAEFLFWRLPMVLCGVKWGGAYFSGYDPNSQQMVWVSLSTDGIWDNGSVPMKVVETIGEDSLETEIPTAKAVWEAVAAVKIFVAEYGVTAFAEIRAAWEQGKACFCTEGGSLAMMVSITADRAEFCSLLAPGGLAIGYSVTSGNVWSTESEVRIKTKIVNALSTDDQIPTAKAVYDAILNAEGDIFVGDYGTTVAEFNEAFASKKPCFMIRPQGGSGNVMWVAYNCSSAYAHFYNITSGGAVQHGVLDRNGEFTTTTVGISDDKIAKAVKEYMDENPAAGSGALTSAQIDALHGMFKVCACDDSKDVSGAYAAFKTAFGITDSGEEEPDEPIIPDEPDTPEVTLTSISATYTGGDVAVGTAVTDLTGIVVTAHYSDGSSETVTGYTLSGTIAEGENTVTVSYGGKTATFTVTGVAESGGETEGEAVIMLTTNETAIDVNKYSDSSIRDARVTDTTDDYVSDGSKFAWYTDEGETSYSGNMVNRSSIRLYTSAEIFDADTEVKVCIEGAHNTYDYFIVGDTEWDGVSAPSSNAIYNCQAVGENAYARPVYREIIYTVKAGRRLVVASYVSMVSVSIIPSDVTPVRYTGDVGSSVPILISEDIFEQDTTVKVKISGSENSYDSFWLASSDWKVENEFSNTHFYNVLAEGSEKWEKPLAVEVNYTVLAGCRLALVMHTGNWSNLAVSVTEVA